MTLPCRTAVVAVTVIATCTPAFVQPPRPTLAIINGKVFTGVSAAPWAEALTIVGDRIGVVGTTASVRQMVDASARVIDARGRVVIPGINDAHMHVGRGRQASTSKAPRSSSRIRRSTRSCSA